MNFGIIVSADETLCALHEVGTPVPDGWNLEHTFEAKDRDEAMATLRRYGSPGDFKAFPGWELLA